MPRAAITALVLLVLCAQGIVGQTAQRVDFLRDSIAAKDDRYIRLLTGSTWTLSGPSTARVTDEVLIVFRDVKVRGRTRSMATAYVNGEAFDAEEVSGRYAASSGFLVVVVEARRNGEVLRLADGTLLAVSESGQALTRTWAPSYRALLTANREYLHNLDEGRQAIKVSPLRKAP
ncbi:MAG: hypothetical protein ABL993_09715 [Vicinamibacterales bacterium]